MSNISSLASSTNAYQATSQNAPGQLAQNFQAIGSALQSGNLTSAQSALATFEQNLQASSQSSPNQPFGKNGEANTDFQAMAGALKSGNLSSAQQAYTSLQSDLKGAQSAHQGHHHHHHGTGATVASTTTSANTVGGGLNTTA
jgi:hypothetical protein